MIQKEPSEQIQMLFHHKALKKHTTTLTEHDLSYPIDYREEQEAEKVKLQLHATNVVTEGLQLKHEKACADLVQKSRQLF